MILSKMLRITERFDDYRVSYETLQKKRWSSMLFSRLPPRACRSCGSTVVDGNGKAIIVKNGKTIVRFEQYNHMPLVMRLKSNAIPVKLSHPLDGSKLFCPADIQSQIMLDIKLLLY